MQLADDWVAKSSLPLVWSVPSAVQRGYTRITMGKILERGRCVVDFGHAILR